MNITREDNDTRIKPSFLRHDEKNMAANNRTSELNFLVSENKNSIIEDMPKTIAETVY
jgi:hypothetical protein